MLEKIGLPPKPSLKGNEWVLDASHCQTCSSAFTLFNRKHHCRRCGGIFCGNCTQQRIILRGQGEGPVRICDPCKKLEEAARFESRYGHRNKVSKVAGSSKSSSSIESDPLLKELLGHDLNSKGTELMDEVSELIVPKHVRSISTGEPDRAGNELPSTQVTPEVLLLQAQEEKKQWLALKKEGKGEEALQAFKRGKELERQAENLKLSLRRSQRKATSLTSRKEKHEEINKLEPRQRTDGSISGNTQGQGDIGVFQTKAKGTGLKERKEKKDDLMDALKEIGWNDADLQDAGGKQSKAKTIENELAELAAAVHQGNNSNRQANTSSMEVLAHKRRALILKREGNLAEAKEELKKAKLMERQLEEQQMFGGEDEESDEELSALIRGIDKESSTHSLGGIDMDFSILGNIDHEEDEGMEVTDVDMDDPEMVAALRSMGWEEEAAQMGKTFQRASAKPTDRSHDYSTSFRGVRKSQKPAAEHAEFLGSMEASLDDVEATEDDMKDPFFLSALKAMGFEEEAPSKLLNPSIPNFKDKKTLQQEVLFLKKEALVLKRAGKLQEAKEELRQAKQLEKELKDFESQNNEEDVLAAFSVQQPSHGHEAEANIVQQTVFPLDEDADNVDVTEEDMGDPELVKTLKSLGWQDDHESEDCLDIEKVPEPYEQSFLASHKSKTKSELQKELLSVKRAALKLRREGKGEEAEDELKKGHLLEQLLEESDRVSAVNKEAKHASKQTADGILNTERIVKVSKPGTEDPNMLASLKVTQFKTDGESLNLSSSSIHTIKQTEKPCGLSLSPSQNNEADILAGFSVQQPSHGHEAEANMLQQTVFPLDQDADNVDVTEEDMGDPELVKTLKSLGWQDDHESEYCLDTEKEPEPYEQSFLASHKSKTKSELQKELLGVKRAALKLRREGKGDEAEDELKKGHLLEQLLEESDRVSVVNKEAKHASKQTADGILNTKRIVKVSKPGTEDPNLLASLKVTEFKTDAGEKINNVHGEFLDDGWQSSLGMEVKNQKASATSSVRAGLSFIPGIIPSERTENILEGEGNFPSTTVVQAALGENLEKGPYVSPHAAEVTAQVKEPLDFVREHLSSFDKEQDTPASVKISVIPAVSSIKASQPEVLALKRQALALKREGRQLEAKDKLREAKLLETKLASEHTHSAIEEVQLPAKKTEVEAMPPPAISAAASSKQVRTSPSAAAQKLTAGKDRMKLQQESLAHKRKALALRREGNTEAADIEFELAKSIEKQMEELGGITEGHSTMLREDDAGSIDDLFDPQLLAALKGLGWNESDILRPMPEVRQEAVEKPQEVSHKKSTEVTSGPSRPKQNNEREQLEEKIKSEKIRAVQLKRSGQQSEALNVLRGTKLLEKKLQSMS